MVPYTGKIRFLNIEKLNCRCQMKVHLGCGTNYLNGWKNVDLDSEVADINLDLRGPLPFADSSVDYIFNEHFIEHITREEGIHFLIECRRVLKPNGVLRVSTPDLRYLITQYLSGKLDEWENVGWVSKSACQLINEGMRWWGHQFLYDEEELKAALLEAGFLKIDKVQHHHSTHTALLNLECRPWHHELIMEAF